MSSEDLDDTQGSRFSEDEASESIFDDADYHDAMSKFGASSAKGSSGGVGTENTDEGSETLFGGMRVQHAGRRS